MSYNYTDIFFFLKVLIFNNCKAKHVLADLNEL